MMDEATLNQIDEALRERNLSVVRVEDTFNVSQGEGIMAQKAHLDPKPFMAQLSENDGTRRREIAGYVRGVKHVLLEPRHSKAGEWNFVGTVGRLMPALEVSTFADGVDAVSEEPAWTLDFCGDLRWVYLIHLDRGIRVLTAPQVERWGVTEDRITAGARSLLFHKTRNITPRKIENREYVHRLHGGDGHDAARALVVADAYYTDIDSGFRFALPSPDHFIFVRNADEESLQELRAVTDEILSETGSPLSGDIFRFETGKPVIAED